MDDVDVRPPSLVSLPSYLAGNVARIGHKALLGALEEHSLRLPQFAVLSALIDFGPLAQYELAERLDLNRSHLVRYLDDLEVAGYVDRIRDQRDRRRQLVALTDAGKGLVTRLQVVARKSQAEFLDVLTAAERKTLLDLLRRVVDANDRARLSHDSRH